MNTSTLPATSTSPHDEILLKGRLNGAQRTRLKKLLDMMYKPSELAAEVGFSQRQIYRVYIPLGCPHQRDERSRIWINGWEFRAWYESTYARATLADDEAFCMTCRRAAKVVNGQAQTTANLTYVLGDCSTCGRRLSRILRQERGA